MINITIYRLHKKFSSSQASERCILIASWVVYKFVENQIQKHLDFPFRFNILKFPVYYFETMNIFFVVFYQYVTFLSFI